MTDADVRRELVERLTVAHAEYRAEVALGWDRQRLFLTIAPVLTAGLAAVGVHTLATRLACGVAALVALAGAAVVHRSHWRCVAAHCTLRAIAAQLGIDDPRPTDDRHVVHVLAGAFVALAALDVALAVLG